MEDELNLQETASDSSLNLDNRIYRECLVNIFESRYSSSHD